MKGRVVKWRGEGKITCNPYFQQRNQIYYETVGLQIFWKTKNKYEILGKGGFPLFLQLQLLTSFVYKNLLFNVYSRYFTQICTLKFRYIFYTFFDHKTPFLCNSVEYRSGWINYLPKLVICNNAISKCTVGLKYIGICTPLLSPRNGLF